MRLTTETGISGNWIVIEDAAPPSGNLDIQYVTINNKKYPAYVDGRDLRLRPPKIKGVDSVEVTFNGVPLGTVQLLA